jgi:hypothetical protein
VEVPRRIAVDREGLVTDERPLRQIMTSWDRMQCLLRTVIDDATTTNTLESPPQCRGPDWMPITPKTGSLFHAETQRSPRRPTRNLGIHVKAHG